MTIQTTTSKVQYTANGSNKIFAYTFLIFDEADIEVYLTDTDGVETLQTLNTDYTVSNVGAENGGNVTFGTAPTSSYKITILRDVTVTQETDYVANDPFPAETHEKALDKLTMIDQQQDETITRALKIPVSDATSTDVELPTSDNRANKYLAFDASGDITVSDNTDVITTAYTKTLLQKSSAAAVRTYLGSGATGDDLFATATSGAALDVLGVSTVGRSLIAKESVSGARAYINAAKSTGTTEAAINLTAPIDTQLLQYDGPNNEFVNVNQSTVFGSRISLLSQSKALSGGEDFEVLQNSVSYATSAGRILEYINKRSVITKSIFTYNGGSTAYTVKCNGGAYKVKGKLAYWDTELTTNAIGSPSASTWFYLYLDHSAITSGKKITASELIWSSTAPTYNTQYKGWYNGNDLCIFAVFTDSGPTNITEFYHDDNFVTWAERMTDFAQADVDTTWVTMTLTIPTFSRKAFCCLYSTDESQGSFCWAAWRTKGSSVTNGHYTTATSDSATVNLGPVIVITNSSQQIEIRHSVSGTQKIAGYTDGWYFPIGM